MNWKKYFQVLIVILVVVLLFLSNVSLHIILIIAVFMTLLIIFKTKLYKKIDKIIRHKFKFRPDFPDWIIKLMITIIFLIAYLLIKQAVLIVIKAFGLDIQGIMVEGINNSLTG